MPATNAQLRDILLNGLEKSKDDAGNEPVPGRVSPEGGVGMGTDAIRNALGLKSEETAEQAQEDDTELSEPAEGLVEDETPEAAIDTAPEGDEPEDGLLTDINALAEGLGVDVAALYDLKIPIPNSEPITFGELKNKYIDGVEAVADQQAAVEQLTERERALEQREQMAAASESLPKELMQAEAAVLLAQQAFQSEDWTTLEATSPGQAALKHQKLKERLEFAVRHRDKVAGDLQQLRSDIANQRQTQMDAYHKQRETQLASLLPEWGKDGARKQEQLTMKDWFDSGAPAATLPGELMDFVFEHAHAGLSAILRDYWQMKSSVQNAKEGGRKPKPKIVRPQAVLATERGQKVNRDRKRQAARNTPDLRKKANFVADLISGRK